MINKANTLLNESTFGTDIGNYPEEQENILRNAINEANEIVNNTATTQEDIDNAVSVLQGVIDNFKSTIIVLETEGL